MRRYKVNSPLDDPEAENQYRGVHILRRDAELAGFHFLGDHDCRVMKPDGSLLLMLIKNVLDPALVAKSFAALRTVSGDPSNRPEIFGKGTRMNRRREDGALSPRIQTAKEFVKAWPNAKADLIGGYRYKNAQKGVPSCSLTSWTRRKPNVAATGLALALAVDEVYRLFAPGRYACQMEYVQQIPEFLRLLDTAFSTMYVIKNKPTAVHRDKFDIPTGMGVMTTLGEFTGAELCFPRFRVAVDYRPGDVLIADVHELHGNLPLVSGERITQVFFVRQGMHECGEQTD